MMTRLRGQLMLSDSIGFAVHPPNAVWLAVLCQQLRLFIVVLEID